MERAFVIHRLQADQQFSAAGEEFEWRTLAKAGVDLKTWLGMVAYACVDVPLYAFSYVPSYSLTSTITDIFCSACLRLRMFSSGI